MSAQVDVLGAIDGLRDLARHRLTMKRREFDKMIAAGKEPNWLASVKADRAEYLVQQGDAARAAVAALIAERDALREALADLRDRVLPAAIRYHNVGPGDAEEALEIVEASLSKMPPLTTGESA